ncbi:MAG: methyltransferase domain-containing protein [Candidatus Omnitrophica bacterium]|nr:methyltransferase domain-containing protein [Candidatus Omnitrophota bacterium]
MGKILIPSLPICRATFNQLRTELVAFGVRLSCRINPWKIYKIKMLQKANDLSVNIGCGPFGETGWINLDIIKAPNLWKRFDVRKSLPLRENSALRIRCEHFLEHLDFHDEVPHFLRHCLRCLKKGGILRIVVPDIPKYLAAYQSGNKNEWKRLGWDLDHMPEGFETQMDILNHVFRQNGEHRYAYDYRTLARLLQKVGFSEVRQMRFGLSSDEALQGDLENHKNYSLYLEAVK